MYLYEEMAIKELREWQKEMLKRPSITNRISKGIQNKANSFIPEKAQVVITETIKNMVRAVLFGSEYITRGPLIDLPLEDRENMVKNRISFYKKTAAISGAGTGAGGILLGLADFPLLIGIKMKFLFDAASLYGFDVKNYKERLYILDIFQVAFSSQRRIREVYNEMANWDEWSRFLPEDINAFDWRTFQQEYRDYIDIAKMLQLVPGIGAAVGAYANYKLMNKLGETTMNAYRMRIFNGK